MEANIEIVPLTWDVSDDGFDDDEPDDYALDDEALLAREEEEEARWRRALRDASNALGALDHTDLPHSVKSVLDSIPPHEVSLLVAHVAGVPFASLAREEGIAPALARKRWERIAQRDEKIEAMQYVYLQKRLFHKRRRPKRTVAQESVAAISAAEEVTRDDPQAQEIVKLMEELWYWREQERAACRSLMPAPLTTVRPQDREYWESQLRTAKMRVSRLQKRLRKMLGSTAD